MRNKIIKLMPRYIEPFIGDIYRRENTYLNNFEKKIYSQNGEDGMIEELFKQIDVTNKYFVEFGVEDGSECNTRYLKEKKGWKGLCMDGNGDGRIIKKEFITAENINQLFKKHKVPKKFDLLSIDIDGNDLWIWKSISNSYKPRVVIMEYNATKPLWVSASVKYNPEHVWDKTNYFGATLKALNKIAKEKGYSLVATNKLGVNAFFVLDNELKKQKVVQPASLYKAYYHTAFGRRKYKLWLGHKKSSKKMVKV